MPFENYVMGWRAEVTKQRYHDYLAGRLDYNEIAVLYQDMVEKETVQRIPLPPHKALPL